jgi:hypothetical protein
MKWDDHKKRWEIDLLTYKRSFRTGVLVSESEPKHLLPSSLTLESQSQISNLYNHLGVDLPTGFNAFFCEWCNFSASKPSVCLSAQCMSLQQTLTMPTSIPSSQDVAHHEVHEHGANGNSLCVHCKITRPAHPSVLSSPLPLPRRCSSNTLVLFPQESTSPQRLSS